MMNKKSQGLPLNIIIIAAIVLIVLVVIIVIFSGKIQLFGKGVTEQSTQYSAKNCELPGTGRECYSDRDSCYEDNGFVIQGRFEDCEEYGEICCQV